MALSSYFRHKFILQNQNNISNLEKTVTSEIKIIMWLIQGIQMNVIFRYEDLFYRTAEIFTLIKHCSFISWLTIPYASYN